MKTPRLNILFEDEHLIAVDKPSGMLVIPGRWPDQRKKEKGTTLVELLQKRISEKVFIVHRLDRDTSGIVLFAKNADAHRKMNQMFEKRAVKKTYRGLIQGRFTQKEGVIKKPLAPCRRSPGLMIVDKREGKPSETRIKVLDTFKDYSWLEISPVTGRSHQIRVHLASLGHPLVCDPLYGILNDEIFLSKLKKRYKKKGADEKPLLSRLALHAFSLEFTHPFTEKPLRIESPLPKDLKATHRQLVKLKS